MAEFHLTEKRLEQERTLLRVADIVRRKLDSMTLMFGQEDNPDGDQQLGVLKRSLGQLDEELAVYLFLRKMEKEESA